MGNGEKRKINANYRTRAYPAALREGLVKLVEAGHPPTALTEFGPSVQAIRMWVREMREQQARQLGQEEPPQPVQAVRGRVVESLRPVRAKRGRQDSASASEAALVRPLRLIRSDLRAIKARVEWLGDRLTVLEEEKHESPREAKLEGKREGKRGRRGKRGKRGPYAKRGSVITQARTGHEPAHEPAHGTSKTPETSATSPAFGKRVRRRRKQRQMRQTSPQTNPPTGPSSQSKLSAGPYEPGQDVDLVDLANEHENKFANVGAKE